MEQWDYYSFEESFTWWVYLRSLPSLRLLANSKGSRSHGGYSFVSATVLCLLICSFSYEGLLLAQFSIWSILEWLFIFLEKPCGIVLKLCCISCFSKDGGVIPGREAFHTGWHCSRPSFWWSEKINLQAHLYWNRSHSTGALSFRMLLQILTPVLCIFFFLFIFFGWWSKMFLVPV